MMASQDKWFTTLEWILYSWKACLFTLVNSSVADIELCSMLNGRLYGFMAD